MKKLYIKYKKMMSVDMVKFSVQTARHVFAAGLCLIHRVDMVKFSVQTAPRGRYLPIICRRHTIEK
jgi:hypothetical protein